MHSSIIITSLCAALAVAKPLQHMGKHIKKDYVTDLDIVIETVFVTVTAGSPPAVETPQAEATTVVVMNTVYAQAETPVATSSPKAAAVFAAVSPVEAAEPAPTTTIAPVVVPTTAAPVVVSTPEPVVAPVPVTSAAPAASGYEGTILERHNAHRANHSANALVYNATLAGYAKNTAQKCVFAHDMTQGGGGYGQNIVENGRLPWTGVNIASAAAFGITEQWYNGEEPLYASSYTKDNPATSADVLHFTQVVWKATTDVGCYTAQCAQGTVDAGAPTAFTVCNYWPQGNFGGQYGNNVAQGSGAATQHATIEWSA
ncbi:PR-1-like protein [Glarea lozoyensis ATCC 20868]|uniref:PR-1-like protein n=2 Tax=Glarea lozoyensis TaxID=101852 RepID=S3DV71_GLAL2|nr:PR-1-like protein [Glarea lozoyensis ATCC 20868]EHK99660.1 putative protein PRY1 [Glarea lozoyensis 74030]EPE35821.1 PR-1-like protein [Glarea lozoyensis ATCC 20868]